MENNAPRLLFPGLKPFYDRVEPLSWLLIRVTAGLMLLPHGIPKVFNQGVAAFAGSRFYLEAARSIGVHRAVVSASLNTAAILEGAGLAQLIEHCVDGATIEAEHLRSKPEPDTLIAACRQLAVEPGQLVAFETTADGIAAARAAGVRLVVCVNRGTEAGTGDADIVVSDLAELFDRG